MPRRLSAARLRLVSAYVRDHLADELTLGTIADVAGIAPHHFARLFKAATGMLPYRFVLHQRIARAATFLVNVNLTIEEIGLAVGIADESHFRRHFRRLTGKTPEQFRVDIFAA